MRRRQQPQCPCGTLRPYGQCCAPFHHNKARPKTAEELMRSRYSAYAKGLTHYIMDTTHPDGEAHEDSHCTWRKELRRFVDQTEFLGLQVLDTGLIDGDPDHALVHFKAQIRQPQEETTLEERSEFRRLHDRWLYCGPLPL